MDMSPYLQVWRVKRARNKYVCRMLYAVFKFGLLIGSENGGDILLRNDIWLTGPHGFISKKTELFLLFKIVNVSQSFKFWFSRVYSLISVISSWSAFQSHYPATSSRKVTKLNVYKETNACTSVWCLLFRQQNIVKLKGNANANIE